MLDSIPCGDETLRSQQETIPFISVIIPVRNAVEWIGETLTSVLSLDYPSERIEIIVVDDASTDNSEDIIFQALAGSCVPWQLHRSRRGGVSAARNLGLESSKGDWIQFLDADDLLAPEKLRVQTAVAATAPQDVAVVYSPWTELSPGWSGALSVRTPDLGSDAVARLLMTENFIATGSQLFRRNWLAKVNGFDERHNLIEDVDLALRIAMQGGRFLLAESRKPLFFYRRHPNSVSQMWPIKFVEGCVRNARMTQNYWLERQGTILKDQKKLLLLVYGNALRFLFVHDRVKFDDLLTHVLELEPRYRPVSPPMLHLASLLFGYPTAEKIALYYRRLKGREN